MRLTSSTYRMIPGTVMHPTVNIGQGLLLVDKTAPKKVANSFSDPSDGIDNGYTGGGLSALGQTYPCT